MLGKLCLISAEHITPKINPYRAILRREYPDPLIALLCFILGIWLWDHYLNEPAGYAPGTEEIALIKIDRDLQLAEAMSDDHPLLRWLAHARSIDKVLSSSQNSLEILIRAQSLSPTGFHAYAVIRSTLEDSPPDFYLNQLNLPSADPDSATWWNLKLADPNFQYPENAAKGNLRNRSILVGSAIWLLAIVGVAFLPSTLKTLGSGLRKKNRGYASGWKPTLGLTVFLSATLAWIGFSMSLDLGLSALPGIHPLLAIFLDAASRMLPALIALGLLFRRFSHAVRVVGIKADIHPTLILGLFSLLVIIDQPLRLLLGHITRNDPTGGLTQVGAGIYGIVFLLVSVCIIAPIAEEILYRGVLFRSLSNRIGVLFAALLSSVIFASLHFYDFYGLASVATFGIGCALLYQATGSLVNVVALHMLYNTSIILPE